MRPIIYQSIVFAKYI